LNHLLVVRATLLAVMTILVVVAGCSGVSNNSAREKTSSDMATFDPSSWTPEQLVSVASGAIARSDYNTVGQALAIVSEWDWEKCRYLAGGFESNDADIRCFSAMTFHVFAKYLTFDEGEKIFDETKNDVRVSTTLIFSVYIAIGKNKASPPQSAVAIIERFNKEYKSQGSDLPTPSADNQGVLFPSFSVSADP